jgi:hypothetical protein
MICDAICCECKGLVGIHNAGSNLGRSTDVNIFPMPFVAKLPAHGGGHEVTKLDEISAEDAGQDGKVRH